MTKLLCISDTHFGDDVEHLFRGHSPVRSFEALWSEMQAIESTVDAVLHLGDVAGDSSKHASAKHYDLTKGLFQRFSKPIISIAGNHDMSTGVMSLNSLPTLRWRDMKSPRTDFSCTVGECPIIGLDSSVFTKRAGHLEEEQLNWCERLLSTSASPLVIMIHHPVLHVASPWMNETMLLANGQRFHQLLQHYQERVHAVLFGHTHSAIAKHCDGVLYCGMPSTIFSFRMDAKAADAEIGSARGIGFAVCDVTHKEFTISYH